MADPPPPRREHMDEFGWCLDPAVQGRGYATEAVRALIAIALEDLGLRRRRTTCRTRCTATGPGATAISTRRWRRSRRGVERRWPTLARRG
ncbi:MAG TPA: GNAT family N-acetyltransferase [Marmoricola sp.]|nr:GNAT family N-acetyltransferase [Marmoricola sp.]